jgi:hypothetical protein
MANLTLNPGYVKTMDILVKKYTGWDSLHHMCLHTPTLRWHKGMSKVEKAAIEEMRTAYKLVTGHEAFPATGWQK